MNTLRHIEGEGEVNAMNEKPSTSKALTVGILALQGAYQAHA
jgi:hypothetical protein